jgi:hypothetical protein
MRREARQIVDEHVETEFEGLVHVTGALREHPTDRAVQALFTRSLARIDMLLRIQGHLRRK